LANRDRPTIDPRRKSTANVDSKVNCNATTPAEGCSPRKRDSLAEPQTARACSEFETANLGAQARVLEESDPPGCVDFTPAPVVIGVNASSSAPPALEMRSSARRKERAARNTPAEPVASVRVRERAAARASSIPDEMPRSRTDSRVCDDRIVTVTDLQPSAQYFPPMWPPESAPGHVATQPKVEVVPDCDTRSRTARSLRRVSSLPPPTARGTNLTQGWPLYLLAAALACVVAIAVVKGVSVIGSKKHSAAPFHSAVPSTSPGAPPSSATQPAAGDAGLEQKSATPQAPQRVRSPKAEGGASKTVGSERATRSTAASGDVTVF